MITYWRLAGAARGAKLHRRDGCPEARVTEMERVERHKPAPASALCRWCYPDDPVKELLAEEGDWYRAEQRENEFAKSLLPKFMEKGE